MDRIHTGELALALPPVFPRSGRAQGESCPRAPGPTPAHRASTRRVGQLQRIDQLLGVPGHLQNMSPGVGVARGRYNALACVESAQVLVESLEISDFAAGRRLCYRSETLPGSRGGGRHAALRHPFRRSNRDRALRARKHKRPSQFEKSLIPKRPSKP